jgi:hypothetical protein
MQTDLTINCPHCHKTFNFTGSITKELREQLRSKLFPNAQREMAKERESLRQKILEESNEHQRLKDLEKDKIITDLRANIDLLQRKATQVSQIRGEVLETDLAEKLRETFPGDEINRIPKGKNGADVLQIVRNNQGHQCGSILWEAKNTNAWTDRWLSKIQDDSTRCKAHIAVIMTRTLPKDIKNFGRIGTVWITNNSCFLGLALVLRSQLIQLAALKPLTFERDADALFNYLNGSEFLQRVETIAQSIGGLKSQLEREKETFNKVWAQREKLIESVTSNMTGICSDLQGFQNVDLPDAKTVDRLVLSSSDDLNGTTPQSPVIDIK